MRVVALGVNGEGALGAYCPPQIRGDVEFLLVLTSRSQRRRRDWGRRCRSGAGGGRQHARSSKIILAVDSK